MWYKFDSRGARLRADDATDDARGIVTIFCAIHTINLIVDVIVRFFHKGDIFLHPTSPDAALMPCLDTVEPGRCASVNGANVKIIAQANNPDNHPFS